MWKKYLLTTFCQTTVSTGREKTLSIIQLTNATILAGMFEKPPISNENANSLLTLSGPCLRPPSSCVSL